jgi:hypothetical protein
MTNQSGKLISLADENQVNSIPGECTSLEDLNSNPDYQAYFQDLQAYLEDLAEERSKVKHISSVKTFPADQMQNPDHLIIQGAEEFTHWLVQEIQKISE